MNNYNFSDLINKKLSVYIRNSKYDPSLGRNISNKLVTDEPLDSTMIYDKHIYIEVDEFV